MEKLLVKTGIYSFIISFSLFVVFLKRERNIGFEEETIYEITPFPEFFFRIFRYSVIISIIAAVVAFLYVYYLKDEISENKAED
ncbi:hypothetical protein [Bacillus sp. Marseille-Q1617]|uniref:hypothetical protein n=1 Tax=Bacillus sp. Marseille-Q1617 TaxID=2736887 RepID=UPI00158CB781|nr:hypothetical protein [Bacillus sp. Marseille-Q1617]